MAQTSLLRMLRIIYKVTRLLAGEIKSFITELEEAEQRDTPTTK